MAPPALVRGRDGSAMPGVVAGPDPRPASVSRNTRDDANDRERSARRRRIMGDYSRRDFLKAGAGVAVGGALGAGSDALFTDARAQAPTCTPQVEKGAKLRLMRWKRFVEGDERVWMENTKRFSDQFGVDVRVDSEGFEDIRPKAAVGANLGQGPDIILGWFDDAHLYPDKLLPATRHAEVLR